MSKSFALLWILFFGADASSRYIKAPLEARSASHLLKRQDSAFSNDGLVLNSNETGYWLNISIGTPPQPFRLHLDTGSSDLVVVKTGAISCSDAGECPSGLFDPSKSTTYEVISEGTFNISYADGDSFHGDFGGDLVDIGGVHLDARSVFIGVADSITSGANHPNDGAGVFGVSYQTESVGSAVFHNGTLPPTSLSAMVASGAINRQAYSLYLGALDAGVGNIVFGGVDPSLYTGDLVAVQVLPDPNASGKYTSFRVPLTGIAVTDDTGTQMLTAADFAIPVLIDSGTGNTKLPSPVVNSLFQGFGASMVDVNALIPCASNSSNASVNFHFGGDGGPMISVPLSSLISPTQTKRSFADGQEACNFGIGPLGNDGHVILGDTFMRSGYFVFDIENNQVGMAAAAVSSKTGNVTPIPSGTDIPGCTSTNTFTEASSSKGGSATDQIPTQSIVSGGQIVPATPTFNLSTAQPGSTGDGGRSKSNDGVLHGVEWGVFISLSCVFVAFVLGELAS